MLGRGGKPRSKIAGATTSQPFQNLSGPHWSETIGSAASAVGKLWW